ncbi:MULTISPECIES: stage II sporulation protein R [Bacillus]|uniref:stage II sporulation protein R n=1 Tax=Bacillus TaxID=1386 RepID=UPI0002D926D2|nr:MULTISPECIES: stage II sporulation protein R [Bacillus]
MNKKYYSLFYIVLLCLATIVSLYIPKSESVLASEEAVVIPNEAIRLRILANSDSDEDQAVKRAIRDEVNANITEWVKDLTSLDEARRVINNHLPDIQNIADRYVKEHGLSQAVSVEFGQAKFPTKLYGQYLYPAGEYEAIVIKIGEAKGANWWCVLFPPLCFLDFSNGTAVVNTPMEDSEEQKNLVDKKPINLDQEEVEKKQAEPINEKKKEEPEVEVVKNHSVKKEADQPLYTEQDEETQVLEKRLFIVDVLKRLFNE